MHTWSNPQKCIYEINFYSDRIFHYAALHKWAKPSTNPEICYNLSKKMKDVTTRLIRSEKNCAHMGYVA